MSGGQVAFHQLTTPTGDSCHVSALQIVYYQELRALGALRGPGNHNQERAGVCVRVCVRACVCAVQNSHKYSI
jgi:hypothetical protein